MIVSVTPPHLALILSMLFHSAIDFNRRRSVNSKQTFWQAHIDAWRESGLSQVAYCKQHKLSLSSFGYWRHKRVSPVMPVAAVPIVVSRPAIEERMDIRLPQGWIVQVPLSVDGTRLVRFLQALAAC